MLSLGNVAIVALGATILAAMFFSQSGVRLAKGFSKRKIEALFGVYFLVVAVRFVASALCAEENS